MAVAMAKKKKPTPTPSTTFGLRLSTEYLQWLTDLAEFERVGRSDVVDRALAAYAEKVGFKQPPKR